MMAKTTDNFGAFGEENVDSDYDLWRKNLSGSSK